MTYVLIIIGIFVLGLYAYISKNVLLPSSIKENLKKLHAGPIEEFIPGETGFATNGAIKICYEVIKPKQLSKGTVLLLNGHGQTLLAYPAHFYEKLLHDGYTIIRMDNRGLGASSWMPEWTKKQAYTLEDMATDAIAVIDKLNIDKVHLIGFSMGGMISQRLAISYPERVNSLTCMATTGFYYDPELVNVPRPFMLNILLLQIIYGRKLTTLDRKVSLFLGINRLLKGRGYFFDDLWYLKSAHYDLTQRSGLNSKVSDQHSLAILKSGSRYKVQGIKNIKSPYPSDSWNC